ncbi:MAG TPA: hypothetical protein VFB31_15110 [Pseudolabrys sp.]|nr:hypothetical protein [Pseudolabrys sp.]
MGAWLRIAAGIDALTGTVAGIAQWALFANALPVVGNATIRKLLTVSALVVFDPQWHIFCCHGSALEWIIGPVTNLAILSLDRQTSAAYSNKLSWHYELCSNHIGHPYRRVGSDATGCQWRIGCQVERYVRFNGYVAC